MLVCLCDRNRVSVRLVTSSVFLLYPAKIHLCRFQKNFPLVTFCVSIFLWVFSFVSFLAIIVTVSIFLWVLFLVLIIIISFLHSNKYV